MSPRMVSGPATEAVAYVIARIFGYGRGVVWGSVPVLGPLAWGLDAGAHSFYQYCNSWHGVGNKKFASLQSNKAPVS